MLEKRISYIFAVLTVCSNTFADIGDRCEIQLTRERGTCQISCPVVESQAILGINPTLCGYYQAIVPIVCCPNDHSNKQQTDRDKAESVTFKPEPDRYNQPEADPLIFPDDNTGLSSNNLRISQQKCEEYSKSFTETVQAIPLVTHAEAIEVNIIKCDHNSVPLIVGGKPALLGEFPFMAAIGFNTDEDRWKCGGTLISDRYILTAAHCTSTRDGAPTVIRLGDLDLLTTADGSEHQDYGIEKIILHPEYKYPEKYNDIALIKTSRTIEFTKFIRPACLYINRNIQQPSGIATGWGKTDFAAESSSKLMKVSLDIYDNSRCSKTYQNNKDLPRGIGSSMLCAGEVKGGKDTCQGDSGGPLLVTKAGNQCKFYVIGVTSFGKSCGQINTPAVYTKVSSYVDWIERTIW